MPIDRIAQFNQTIRTSSTELADLNRVLYQSGLAMRNLDVQTAQALRSLQALQNLQRTAPPGARYDPAIARVDTALTNATNRGAPQYRIDQLNQQRDSLLAKQQALNDALANQITAISSPTGTVAQLVSQREKIRTLRPDTAITTAARNVRDRQASITALQGNYVTALNTQQPQVVVSALERMIDAETTAMEAEIKVLQQWDSYRRGVIANAGNAPVGSNNLVGSLTGSLNQPNLSGDQQTLWDRAGMKKVEYDKMLESAYAQNDMVTQLKTGRYSTATKEFSARGFGVGDIKSIKASGLEGIEKLTGAYKDPLTQINHSLDLFVDKTGRVLPTVTRQFSTFASSIGRDFRELAKWTIAIGLIYGPMRKMQEMVTLMIANEVKLADASIAVSDSTLKMGEIFDIANEAANAMGENVGDVIVNFKEAYQATGGLAKPMERIAQATQLMNDALLLSKLSSLNATQSIDVLSSALRQSGLHLDEANKKTGNGASILDKWVKVTKVANVSLDTLATGFSVLGEAADAAGLTEDELNAVLAVTAETMGVTGKEAANMARSFVAGFQSDKAVKALEDVGIATKTTTGDMRNLLAIQEDLYQAKLNQTISPETYSKLTLAIGGGTRRQAPLAGFIESQPRIQEIVAAQADAEGAATAALAKQLDTVQTSLTRLQNAFQSLAQSLGDEGGLLNVFKLVVDILSSITTLADKAFATMGKTGPVLMMALAAGALLKRQGPLALENFAMTASTNVAKLARDTNALGVSPTGNFVRNVIMGQQTVPAKPQSGMLFAPGIGKLTDQVKAAPFSVERVGGTALAAGLAAIGPVIQNLSAYNKGESEFGRSKAAANATGALIGAAIASTFGPMGSFIGASIGQAIAESFVNTATSNLSAFKTSGMGVIGDLSTKPPVYGETVQSRLGGAGSGPWGGVNQFMASTFAWLTNASNTFNAKYGKKEVKGGEFTGYKPEEMPYYTTENLLYHLLPENKKKEFDTWKAEQISEGKLPAEPRKRPVELDIKEQQDLHGSYIDTQRKMREQEFLDKMIQGKMTPTAYLGKMDTLGTFEERSTKYFATFGQQFIDVSKDINTAEEAYSAFLDIFSYGNEEQLSNITAMSTEVADLTNKIQALNETGGSAALAQIPGLETKKEDLQKILAGAITQMYNTVQFEKFPIPTMVNESQPIQMNKPVLASMIKEAEAGMINYYTSPKLGEAQRTPAQVDEIRKQMEDFGVVIEEGGKLVYYTFTELVKTLGLSMDKISPEMFEKFLKEYIASGKIEIKAEVQKVGFESYDITQAKFDQAMTGYDALRQKLTVGPDGKPTGYVSEESPLVQMFKDGVVRTNSKDWSIVAVLLQRMLDIDQKQLDGMYNIPDGASFWIPYNEELIRMLQAGFNGTGDGSDVVGAIDNSADRIVSAIEGLSPEAIANYDKMQIEKLKQQGYGQLPEGFRIPTITPALTPYSVREREREGIGGHGAGLYYPNELLNQPKDIYKVDKYGIPIETPNQNYGQKPITPTLTPLDLINRLISAIERASGGRGFGSKPTPFEEASHDYRDREKFPSGTGPIPGYGTGIFGVGNGAGMGAGLLNLFGSVLGGMKQESPQQTKIDIRMDSKVQLIVDGRTLANVVRVYLLNDLLKAQAGFGTGTKNVVITAT